MSVHDSMPGGADSAPRTKGGVPLICRQEQQKSCGKTGGSNSSKARADDVTCSQAALQGYQSDAEG